MYGREKGRPSINGVLPCMSPRFIICFDCVEKTARDIKYKYMNLVRGKWRELLEKKKRDRRGRKTKRITV
jgi:hypothetical protein